MTKYCIDHDSSIFQNFLFYSKTLSAILVIFAIYRFFCEGTYFFTWVPTLSFIVLRFCISLSYFYVLFFLQFNEFEIRMLCQNWQGMLLKIHSHSWVTLLFMKLIQYLNTCQLCWIISLWICVGKNADSDKTWE